MYPNDDVTPGTLVFQCTFLSGRGKDGVPAIRLGIPWDVCFACEYHLSSGEMEGKKAENLCTILVNVISTFSSLS